MKLTKNQILSLFDFLISKTLYLGTSLDKRVKDALVHKDEYLEILPFQLSKVSEIIQEHNFKFSVLIGYPLGISSIEAKLHDIRASHIEGVDEIVLMPNLAALKNGEYDLLKSELSEIKKSCQLPIKIVLNNVIISRSELDKLSELTEMFGIILVHSYENINFEKKGNISKVVKKGNLFGKTIKIRLKENVIDITDVSEEHKIFSGRNLCVDNLLNSNITSYGALDLLNKVVISPGTLAGANIGCASHTAIGFKSPLNEAIKISSIGGNFGSKLSSLGIKSLLIDESCNELSLLYISKEKIEIIPCQEYKELGIEELFDKIYDDFGKNVAIIGNGPAGERNFLTATLIGSDEYGNPNELLGKGGGIGAVFGNKNIKAIIVDSQISGNVYNEKLNNCINTFEEHLLENTIIGRTLPKLSSLGFFNVNNMLGTLPCDNFRKSVLEKDIVNNINNQIINKYDFSVDSLDIIKHRNKRKNSFRNLRYIDFASLGLINEIYDLTEFEILYDYILNLGLDPVEFGVSLSVARENGFISKDDNVTKIIEKLESEDWRAQIIFQGAAVAGKTLGVSRVAVINGEAMLPYDIRAMELGGICQSNSMSNDENINFFASYYYLYRNIPDNKSKFVDVHKNLYYIGAILNTLGFNKYINLSILKDGKVLDYIINIINILFDVRINQNDVFKLSQHIVKSEKKLNSKCGIFYDFNIPHFFKTESNILNRKYNF